MTTRQVGGEYVHRDTAFPTRHTDDVEPGMDLRDWFAGMAMAGSSRQFDKPAGAAKWAYDVAEAMLKERERT
jgi:hypothetical protein